MGGHLCNDWRITNQMNYLFRARLIKTTFSESSHSDHEHCEFCWARFSALPEDLHGGYYEPQSESWLCPDCVEQFSDLFGWTVTEAEDDEE